MAHPRHLSKAPITEALIDIRVALPRETGLELLDSLYNHIKDKYPKRRERKRWEGTIEFKETELVTPSVKVAETDGYLYTSEDDKQTVQARLDGFTFNRQRPYETWETLRDEAHRLWDLYAKIASPELITRVAVRYINQLDLPFPIKDFADFLVAPPLVPEALPQGVSSFLTRVVINEQDMKVTAIIHQALESFSQSDKVPIILDIDVFKQVVTGLDETEAWETLEWMRHFKNRIFFESVTENTLRLFA